MTPPGDLEDLEADLLEYRKEAEPLSHREREWLDTSRLAAEYAQGEVDIEVVSVGLDALRFQRPSQFEQRNEIRSNWRSRARAEISALEAARVADVIDFRADVLDGELVPVNRIEDWVSSAAERDGAPTTLVLVPTHLERVPKTPEEAQELGLRNFAQRSIVLGFPREEGWAGVVKLRADGVLDRLRRVAESLEGLFGWSQPVAVGFILAGVAPPATRGSGSISHHFAGRRGPATGWRTTVTITVDAEETSPSEVAYLYRDLYHDLVRERSLSPKEGGRRGEPGAGRPMQEKNARLAVFAAQNRDAGSWAELRTKWNAEHPEWKYTDRRAFGRACRKAYERVTGQPLERNETQSKG